MSGQTRVQIADWLLPRSPDCRGIENRQRSTPSAPPPPPPQHTRRSPAMAARVPRLVLGRVDACVVSLIGHHFVISGVHRCRQLSRKCTATECRYGGYYYNQPFHENSPVD